MRDDFFVLEQLTLQSILIGEVKSGELIVGHDSNNFCSFFIFIACFSIIKFKSE